MTKLLAVIVLTFVPVYGQTTFEQPISTPAINGYGSADLTLSAPNGGMVLAIGQSANGEVTINNPTATSGFTNLLWNYGGANKAQLYWRDSTGAFEIQPILGGNVTVNRQGGGIVNTGRLVVGRTDLLDNYGTVSARDNRTGAWTTRFYAQCPIDGDSGHMYFEYGKGGPGQPPGSGPVNGRIATDKGLDFFAGAGADNNIAYKWYTRGDNAYVLAKTMDNQGNEVAIGSYSTARSITANVLTSPPTGGASGVGLMVSSTSNLGVFFGVGAPTLQAAKGSLYLRSDGSTTNDRAYINTDGATTWTALTTVN